MGARFIYACAMTKSNAIKATLFANKHNSFLFQFEFFRLAVLKIKLKKKTERIPIYVRKRLYIMN